MVSESPDSAGQESAIHLVDPQFMAELRAQMLKFAILHLKDVHVAEDTVQEALVGALKNSGSFARRSALKTWVFAILKNKIADTLRHQKKHPQFSNDGEEGVGKSEADYFDSRGHWLQEEKPGQWHQPMEDVKNEHFWKVFEACLDRLPPKQARLFMMREFLEFESHEICESMELSTSNLHVLLYRARLRLRDCLEQKWFENEGCGDV